MSCRNINPDTGLGAKAEVRSRSVRVRNLPPDTQEALLQQAMEKITTVKRVVVLAAKNEAVVELENASVSVISFLLVPNSVLNICHCRKLASSCCLVIQSCSTATLFSSLKKYQRVFPNVLQRRQRTPKAFSYLVRLALGQELAWVTPGSQRLLRLRLQPFSDLQKMQIRVKVRVRMTSEKCWGENDDVLNIRYYNPDDTHALHMLCLRGSLTSMILLCSSSTMASHV